MNSSSIVTLDIGGTTINAGRFQNGIIEEFKVRSFAAHENEAAILAFIVECIDSVKKANTIAIAIGVPCILDVAQGVVFDAINIPAWQNYHLKAALSTHYHCDIYLNNDVNCFVAGEYAFGGAQSYQDVVGICLGTGFGTGYILNKQLYAGQNCCAGEVGGISYLDGTIDDYCSGQFFTDHYQMTGAELAQLAEQNEVKAIKAFEEFGEHLAQAISMILFVLNPQVIVLGGSVAKSYHLFIDALWRALAKFPYQRVINNLTIVKSDLENAALLGAAHLYLNSKT
ncbi:ROK family protein [Colwellia sp. 1_MG-2023]|uniref:ROK family protein n=1 Tax=Colwellia sp. 1_MG-2023 TaxID=3062649 RepID=UPI0026E39959|nr:ROK family protein [Colwellia sp. 1_MG-2023]MDO6445485.1 ROK family protein [Colwellia sp. 1_MG-2023]